MKKNNTHPVLPKTESPWNENPNMIWLASVINLSRNLDNFCFPLKLDSVKKKEILDAISGDILSEPTFMSPTLIKVEQMSPVDKEFLYEHYLTNSTFHQAHSGEGFILDESGRYLIMINIKDHIQFQVIDCSGELEETWNSLIKMETSLGKKVNYAFSSKFGFLTADLTNCGTAMNIAVYMQIPALIHTGRIDEFLASHRDPMILLTGIQGKTSESIRENIGDILAVHNNYTLGVTEENIISTVRSFCTKLLVMEKSARTEVREHDNAELKDKVSRAYGVLIHSYQIDTIEAMNALSLLKLSVDLGWLSGITIEQLNNVFFNCRRAHLLTLFGKEIPQEDLLHKRAEYIHQILSAAKLNI